MTDENSLLQFFDQIKASLDRDSVKTVEGPQPLMLGDVPCVRYVIRKGFHVKNESGAEDRSFRGEREVVETLAQGRIYSVILDTYEGKIDGLPRRCLRRGRGTPVPAPEVDR